ncbi:MAG: lytic murein transglycosylase B [Gammaproteobacteria bacterium]|nr:lytic murein transglycosylase B [Gammaproteobacteria bacterium]MDH3534183.1 lytic murein transglycosylase B [Gammaproteobacteria bacterium]
MRKITIIIIGAVATSLAFAAEIPDGDYQGRSDVSAFVERMAQQSDYTEKELIGLFAQVEKQEHLFEKLDKPAEKELDWYQYRRIFLKDTRIESGVKFWRQHRDLLAAVSDKTGVPAEIIVAIIGVETFYGVYKGKDPVFDSLVTLAFDYPRRASFFMQELEQFLLLAREQGFNARDLRGSYAGAMGMPQFISSSYRNYAIDFDDDGQTNLFDSIPDIAGSVANYFVRHGWQRDGRVARPLTAAANNSIDALEPGLKPVYKWADLKRSGLASEFEIGEDTPVALVRLQQRDHAEYWAGFQNFYVITRYNHSELYAMAVYQLARLISHQYKKTA